MSLEKKWKDRCVGKFVLFKWLIGIFTPYLILRELVSKTFSRAAKNVAIFKRKENFEGASI